MTFQAYIDTIERKSGKTKDELMAIAKSKGFLEPDVKAGQVVEWFKQDYDLGHGHSMAMWLLIKQARNKNDQ